MRHLPLIALIVAIAACAPSRREPAPVVYQGTAPSGQQQSQAQARPAPIETGVADARGVVLYDGYEAIRARRGDSVDAMARRIGLSGAELAAYNGLSTLYSPEEGDELVLPPRADRYAGATAVASTAPTPAPAEPATQQAPSSIPSKYQPSVPAPGEEDADIAAAEPAPQPQPAPQQSDSASGWSPALARAAIEAPAEDAAAATAPEPTPVATASPAPVEEPQPAAAPAAAAEQEIAVEPEPTVVALNAGATAGFFQRPTAAPVSRPFSRAPGPDRNDGVDFSTSAGDPVVAAEAGTVALISKSLGGLGTIVLIRHEGQFLTVYGRLGGVTVAKGDRVERGQVIATVADLQAPKLPHLHFEVRKGAESVDPMQYF